MRARRKAKGPRIVGRYDPTAEVERLFVGEGEQDFIKILVRGDHRALYVPAFSPERVAGQRDAPVKVNADTWLYHDYWVVFEHSDTYREDEIVLLIKRVVLGEERELARIRQEVETLERLGDLPLTTREMISDDVRMFVWQRDGGKCVRCDSNEKLEFDHIIPVADGGSSTERNVQLLCESCNRSKGRSVT